MPATLTAAQKVALASSGGERTRTALRRGDDGTVTVVTIARAWTPALTRQDDGTVTVS
jgi:hypothetical protein